MIHLLRVICSAERDAMASCCHHIRRLLLVAFVLSLGACENRNELALPASFDERAESAGLHFDESTELQRIALTRSEALLDAGQRQAAQEQLAQLADSEPQSQARARAIVLFAETLAADGQSESGIERLLELETISPPWGPLYFSLGRLYIRSGDRQLAERSFRDAIRADPTLLRAYVGLASLLDEDGHPDQANLVMLNYERELYRLAQRLQGSTSVSERLQLIEVLSQATPDPRISRILANSLTSDSQRVQFAALDALDGIGTDNALTALRALRESTGDPVLQGRALDVAQHITER